MSLSPVSWIAWAKNAETSRRVFSLIVYPFFGEVVPKSGKYLVAIKKLSYECGKQLFGPQPILAYGNKS